MGTSLTDGQVPEQVLVAPWGEVASSSGVFVVDEETGQLVVEAFEAHGTDLPIDYEHQTLGGEYASPSGAAPAAGWITKLEAVPGEGIVATVNWTEQGRKMIGAKAYRYVSPVALIRQSDRRLVALHSVALTNKPGIVGMAAIVNGERSREEAGRNESLTALCAKLRLGEETAPDSVLLAAKERIEVLEAESVRRDAEAAVSAAAAAGKLTAAQRDWAMRLATNQRDLFDEWLRAAPVVVLTGRTESPAAGSSVRSGRHVVAAAARTEYRACRALQAITSEEAFVADALREERRMMNDER